MIARIFRFVGVMSLWFAVVSLALVIVMRFVPPPFTLTMAGDLLAGHSITKKWRPLDEIDRDMARAAIAGEDAKFCSHHGFDFKAMAGAAYRNAQGGRIRGGSTISQQTAKNVFLFQGGGYIRKAFEAWFTVLIEALWGKRRIMEVYLNVAETGIGTYGVEADRGRPAASEKTRSDRADRLRSSPWQCHFPPYRRRAARRAGRVP